MSEQRLFDIAAAVAYLRSLGATAATEWFVRGLITSGSVPRIAIGRKFYVTRESLDAWIARSGRRTRT